MSDSLTKKRACLTCGEDISHKRSDARFCSRVCNKVVYTQENHVSILEKKQVYYQKNREVILAKKAVYHQKNYETLNAKAQSYRQANRDELAVRGSHKWYTTHEPYRDRICSIFERMTDNQRTRFANHILRKANTRLLVDGVVDVWLADYNTLE